MITLKDVAREAGVSIATVSCALSGKKAVRPETYTKIMDAVEKLKYIPNYSARNLKKKASNMVSVLLPGMRSQFYSGLFDGISSYLQSHGYSINIAFSNDSADVECTKIDEFITQNSAGLIIVTTQPGNTAFFQNHIMDYQIPAVFVEREPDSVFCNYVGFRHYDTFHSITSVLSVVLLSFLLSGIMSGHAEMPWKHWVKIWHRRRYVRRILPEKMHSAVL